MIFLMNPLRARSWTVKLLLGLSVAAIVWSFFVQMAHGICPVP
jgi:hypothetical protein